jgi:hypothetical protein
MGDCSLCRSPPRLGSHWFHLQVCIHPSLGFGSRVWGLGFIGFIYRYAYTLV